VRPRGPARATGAALLLACGGCAVDRQSALHPRGAEAGDILALFLGFAVVCALVYLLVVAALAVALLRHRRAHVAPVDDRRLGRGLRGWAGFVATTLFVLAVASWAVDRRIALAAEPAAVHVRVTAHQWWWQVEYEHGDPDRRIETANELILPVGETAILELVSPDVIHSFWVPALHGKTDLIPGRTNQIRLTPTRIGRYRGQCAEFCGLQHAHMAFDVAVVPAADFRRWQDAQRASARVPVSDDEHRGQQTFMQGACASCHQVRGTPAGGRVGPDLTHVASRATLAAGTLPNDRGQLAAWLADPQGIKPGAHMPYVGLAPDELHALTAYLGSLR
jgi:cytochrome c oxidase subunit 2